MTTSSSETPLTTDQHTPGPWHKAMGDYGCETIRDANGRVVPLSYGPNARLIAAAPEMFALLTQMEDWLRPELEKEPDRTFFWKLVELRRKITGKDSLFSTQEALSERSAV